MASTPMSRARGHRRTPVLQWWRNDAPSAVDDPADTPRTRSEHSRRGLRQMRKASHVNGTLEPIEDCRKLE
jgi:hypothetical protein